MQGVLFKGNRAQVLVSEVVFSPFMALFVICFCMSVNSSPSSLKCVHVLIYSVKMAEFVGTCIEVLSYSQFYWAVHALGMRLGGLLLREGTTEAFQALTAFQFFPENLPFAYAFAKKIPTLVLYFEHSLHENSCKRGQCY